jgi:hypothetical protein
MKAISRFVYVKYLGQLMMFTKPKQVKEMPQTLQIKRKAMIVIKLVFNDDYFSNMSSYNNKINHPLKQVKHAIN